MTNVQGQARKCISCREANCNFQGVKLCSNCYQATKRFAQLYPQQQCPGLKDRPRCSNFTPLNQSGAINWFMMMNDEKYLSQHMDHAYLQLCPTCYKMDKATKDKENKEWNDWYNSLPKVPCANATRYWEKSGFRCENYTYYNEKNGDGYQFCQNCAYGHKINPKVPWSRCNEMLVVSSPFHGHTVQCTGITKSYHCTNCISRHEDEELKKEMQVIEMAKEKLRQEEQRRDDMNELLTDLGLEDNIPSYFSIMGILPLAPSLTSGSLIPEAQQS